jgi:unsaturated rhamnogalacturonyl hydrolase
LWYDIQAYNGPGKEKNYFEASSSSQFVYAIAKSVRKGYLPASKISIAQRGYDGIIKQFISIENGQTNLNGTVKVSGLGGKPYRDGSFEYYMSEPVIVNSPIGVGAFLLASTEMDLLPTQSVGKGKTVLLDYYFNNEWKKDATGTFVRWHYTWEDRSNSGFGMLGDIFNRYGVQTKSLDKAPIASNLKGASIYIIVDPDTDKETDKPNYVGPKDIIAISNWVKQGGVLVLLSNDAGNAEFKNVNQLAARFGIQFNEDSKNHVEGKQFEQGAIYTPANHPIFNTPKKLYIKELSTLQVQSPAEVILKNDDDNIMAVSRYGNGTVFALGDPWIYNEYLDGRKLPATFENYQAAEEWVKWLIQQTNNK